MSAGCASCAPTNYNNQIIENSNLDYGCASCAPTNYNGDYIAEPGSGNYGALRAHQRITTSEATTVFNIKSWCAPYAPMNYNRKRISKNT